MKDFLGVELQEGDSVAVMAKNYRSLVRARVEKITAKKIVVQYLNNWNYGNPGVLEIYIVESSMLIKI